MIIYKLGLRLLQYFIAKCIVRGRQVLGYFLLNFQTFSVFFLSNFPHVARLTKGAYC